MFDVFELFQRDCQQIAVKIQELSVERDEHRLVVEQLSKLEGNRKAYRYTTYCYVLYTYNVYNLRLHLLID